MLTSDNRQGHVAKCRQLGIERYLTKPITQAELLHAVSKSLFTSRPSETVPRRQSSQNLPSDCSSLRILLAEDNLVNQKIAMRVLQKRGHCVEVVNNGLEALDVLEERKFDLVLMDIQMPVMGGIEAVQLIREKERATGAHLPIIALTAHAMKEDRERCLKAGMDGYLSKPISAQELLSTMESALR